MRGDGGGGVLMKESEGFMGVKEKAVVTQKIPTVSLFFGRFSNIPFLGN